MATTREMIEAFCSVRDPYLYHGANRLTLPYLLRDGLVPRALTGNHAYDGSDGKPEFRSRPGHVYLGTLEHLDRIPLEPLVRIDLRELDPNLICSDEDVFWELDVAGDDKWRWFYAMTGMNDDTPFPEFSSWMRAWKDAGASFGDWADCYAVLIDRPEWVALSLAYGSIAYDGPVPAEAITVMPEHAHVSPAPAGVPFPGLKQLMRDALERANTARTLAVAA